MNINYGYLPMFAPPTVIVQCNYLWAIDFTYWFNLDLLPREAPVVAIFKIKYK